MHYMTHRSHRMQKDKFCVTCPGMLCVKFVPVTPKHEKYCIDISCPGSTGVHYVTHKSYRM
jgi:hypothetical protein